MKTFRKSSLITSVALLLVAIVALGGATFAWFSSNTTATAGTLSMTAQSSSSIYIVDDTANIDELGGAPDEGWTSSLKWNDPLTGLAPASTTIDKAFNPTFYYTTSSSDDGKWSDAAISSTTVDTVAGTRYFVAKKIWVYADGTNENSVLTGSVKINSDKANPYCRAAIVNATNSSAEDYVLAPSFFAETADSALAFTGTDGKTATIAAKAATEQTPGTVTYTGEIGKDNAQCFVIYFWFEGQDENCKNSNASENFTFDISFSVATPNT